MLPYDVLASVVFWLVRLVLLVSLAGCVTARPPFGAATLAQATVRIMANRVSEDGRGLDSYPACFGVAVGPNRILTAAHCVGPSPVSYVDALTWATTSSGYALADVERTVGELAVLRTRTPLRAWVAVAHGDSGAGVPAPSGELLGIVQACNSSNDKDCDLAGGRYTPIAPAMGLAPGGPR